jgi:Cu(I)/Ag(I) efflux system membrane fusion protein
VHIPREALIRGGAADRVVLALGDGRFRSQRVEIGIESGDRVAILEGLSAGDLVVSSGQFLIDSESNIGSALSRMGDSAPEVIDHSQHEMDAAEEPMAEPVDHSQHETEPEQ